MKKIFALTLSLIIFSSGILAADAFKTIKATLREDINLELNGKILSLKDAKGQPISPISYNGTTYLPVRAIADNLSLDVEWINETKTVRLVEKKDNKLSSQNVNTTDQHSGKIKGNKNTKKYHIPGGRYYNTVKDSNAIYFETEEAAIKAGYIKAQQ